MALANEILDFSETTRRSPGQHGQARTPAEREQLVRLYADQTWSISEKQEQGFEADREPAIRKASQAK